MPLLIYTTLTIRHSLDVYFLVLGSSHAARSVRSILSRDETWIIALLLCDPFETLLRSVGPIPYDALKIQTRGSSLSDSASSSLVLIIFTRRE